MDHLREFVEANDGFATKRQLVARGATDRMLTAAVRWGSLTRVRNGWYTTRHADEPAVRAIRVGGRLTGMSALRELGVWEWHRRAVLHVAVRRRDSRLRRQDDRRKRYEPGRDPRLRVHWEADDRRDAGTVWAVPLLDALARVVLDESFETAVIALDWALATGRIDMIDVHRILAHAPRDRWAIADWVSDASHSILESRTRVRLRERGLQVRTQAWVSADVSPADLIVDETVMVETDGTQFYVGRFDTDRRKDLSATRAGLHALRPTWSMVRDEWDQVESAVLTALALRLGSAHVATCLARAVGNSGLRVRMRRATRRPPARAAPSS